MPNVNEMNLIAANEQIAKEEAMSEITPTSIDPFAMLDYQFTMQETENINNAKRQKLIDNYNILAKAEVDHLNEMRYRSPVAAKERTRFFIDQLSDRDEEAKAAGTKGWSKSYEGHVNIPRVYGHYYFMYNSSSPPDLNSVFIKSSTYLGLKNTPISLTDPRYMNYSKGTYHYYRIPIMKWVATVGKERAEHAFNHLGFDENTKFIFRNKNLGFGIEPPALQYILMQCYPTVREYEDSPASYPKFINYLEDTDLSDPQVQRIAMMKWVEYGTRSYAERAIEALKLIANQNANPNNRRKHVVMHTDEGNHYKDVPIMKKNTLLWWWPRPRPGYVYIPKIGYVNPFYVNLVGLKSVDMEYQQGWFYQMRDNFNRNVSQLKEFLDVMKEPWNVGAYIFSGGEYKSLGRFMSSYVGDMIGEIAKAINPIYITHSFMRDRWLLKDIYREMNYFTGGLLDKIEKISLIPSRAIMGDPITTEDWMLIIEAVITAVVIYFSAGTATALIGASASQLSQGPLGKSEFGRTLLSFAEVYAVANIAQSSVSAALKKQTEKELRSLAIKELGESTGWDESIVGRLALHVTVDAATNMIDDPDFINALTESAQGEGVKQAKLELARENPYAAMALAMSNEIEKHGWGSVIPGLPDFSNPAAMFDSIDWSKLGPNAVEFAKSIDAADVKKYTALLIGIGTGNVSDTDAALFIGQDIAVKNLDKFYAHDTTYVRTEDDAKFDQAYAEVQKKKKEIQIWNKVKTGKYIPTYAELNFITQNGEVTDFLSRIIENAVPEGAWGDAWKVLGDIGIPTFDFPESMKIGSVDVPEWMKISVPTYQWMRDLEEKFHQRVNEEISKIDWENAIRDFLIAMLPSDVPLKNPLSPDVYDYSWMDELKNLNIRQAQNFGYEHPMVQSGALKRKWSAKQIAYRSQRIKEIKDVIAKLEWAETQKMPPGLEIDYGVEIEQLEQLV